MVSDRVFPPDVGSDAVFLPGVISDTVFAPGVGSDTMFLPGVSGSKAQMVAPCGAVRAMVPITLKVTWYSWRLLSTPRGSLCNPRGHSVLLPQRFLAWGCSH